MAVGHQIGDESAGHCHRLALLSGAAQYAVDHCETVQYEAWNAGQADAQSGSRSGVGPVVDLAAYPSIALFLSYSLRRYLLGVNVQHFRINFLDHTKSTGPLSQIVGSFYVGELRIKLLTHDGFLGPLAL